jgi:hypothetical protein
MLWWPAVEVLDSRRSSLLIAGVAPQRPRRAMMQSLNCSDDTPLAWARA